MWLKNYLNEKVNIENITMSKEGRIEKEYKSVQGYTEKELIRYEKFMRFVERRLTNKKLWWVLITDTN